MCACVGAPGGRLRRPLLLLMIGASSIKSGQSEGQKPELPLARVHERKSVETCTLVSSSVKRHSPAFVRHAVLGSELVLLIAGLSARQQLLLSRCRSR